ncbi:N-acetylglucosamine-6-phosphate deacetylase [Saccharothrix australiensis]|uniref:N-acetylglucosamine-6-phosphate deacetylase n=1 Tax=Saccharothrix australiensis TaxID=2072 RepID=A0A495VXA3_9PSEU|nr:N-acetylglucosamine-6-phosphate deacetylase [Saccharothrix australiensis]RKT52248.1 N-acetylglucosamine-6-phosphate deacetylase [Saccharothrix australiensis]
MDTVVAAPRALVGRAITGPVSVRVAAGRIVGVDPGEPPAGAEVLTGGLLTPGLVDVQVNGAVGVDFAEVDDEGMRSVARALPRTGVTRFLPTLITAPVPVALRQARAVLAASAALPPGSGARPLGVHLEGPFLSPKRPGVHDPALMVEPGPAEIDLLLADDLRQALRVVTLAPERPGGLAAVRRLSEAGVLVAVGHSDATGEQTRAAAEAGARMVTHLFNAQRPLGHREPGVPGVALVDDRFTLGLIADLAHVGPDVCRLVFNAAGHRVALVTDAMAAAGMPPGRYQLGGADVLLAEDDVPRSPEGTIAGSALTLDRAVRNIVSVGVPLADALASATIVPADVIGEPTLGRLAPDAVADLVWWDDDLRPRKVWVDGEVVFDAEVDLSPELAAAG